MFSIYSEESVRVPAIHTTEEAWALRNGDRAAVRAATETLLANAGGDLRAAAQARVILSYLDFRLYRYEQAATAGMEALGILEAGPVDPWLPRLYNTLAIIHYELGERDTSAAYLDRQIRLSREIGDRQLEAQGYHDLGLHQSSAAPQHGLSTIEQALAISHSLGDAENEALALYNIANIHYDAGDEDLAASYSAQAIELIHGSSASATRALICTHIAIHMAEAASAQGRYAEAHGHFTDAYDLAARDAPELLPMVQYCRGRHLIDVGDYAEAIAQVQSVLVQIGPSGHKALLTHCHAALAECSEQMGDYRAALAHYKAYAAAQERTFNETNEQKVRSLGIIHQTEATRRVAEIERQRNTELQRYIQELEQLHATLREISLRDPLTGLYNRRHLIGEGKRQLLHAQRDQSDICAAMIDVDHFKRVNDELSHQIGDLVLKRLAEIINCEMRDTDIVARYGGEEFSVILPETHIDNAYIVCERLRVAVEQYDWASIHPRLRVTISIGVAVDDHDALEALLARADEQLYVAKRAGRNRTFCAPAASR